MNTQKHIEALVAHYGNQTATAAALDVSQPTVRAWLNSIHGISAKTALKIEARTGGKFKAVDLCLDLMPAETAI